MIALLLAGALAADPPAPRSVHLSGVLASTAPGPYRVEVLLDDPDGGLPLLAWSGVLGRPGPFDLEVPIDLGDVHLRIAADVAGDGIGADDPQAIYATPIRVGRQDITGIELSLVRTDIPRAPGESP